MSTALPQTELASGFGRDATFGALSDRVGSLKPLGGDASDAEVAAQRAELRKAAQDFEAMFINLVLKEMRPDEEEDGLFGSSTAGNIYREMFDTELSKTMSGSGQLGLAEMIERQVAQSLGIELEDGVETIPGQVLNRAIPEPLRRSVARAYEAVEQTAARTAADFAKPLFGGRVSSEFGLREDPIDGRGRQHKGVDIAAPEGTPVKASADGKVSFSGWQPGYGNMVIIEHAGGYETRYAHNSDNLVRKGEVVKQGQVVASVGSTGRSTGSHLHFEVRREGAAVDPFGLIR